MSLKKELPKNEVPLRLELKKVGTAQKCSTLSDVLIVSLTLELPNSVMSKVSFRLEPQNSVRLELPKSVVLIVSIRI